MTATAIEALERLAADVPLADSVDAPDWENCGETWAAYVPDDVRAVWRDLPREARLMAAILGDRLVDQECHD
jgi:hypothetical protein